MFVPFWFRSPTHRLKSFYEEGEREMMNEQVMVLQNKVPY